MSTNTNAFFKAGIITQVVHHENLIDNIYMMKEIRDSVMT